MTDGQDRHVVKQTDRQTNGEKDGHGVAEGEERERKKEEKKRIFTDNNALNYLKYSSVFLKHRFLPLTPRFIFDLWSTA